MWRCLLVGHVHVQLSRSLAIFLILLFSGDHLLVFIFLQRKLPGLPHSCHVVGVLDFKISVFLSRLRICLSGIYLGASSVCSLFPV